MSIECSAKQRKGCNDLMQLAQKVFLFPVAPLRNNSTKVLTKQYEKAILRIFRQLDVDNDRYLNANELYRFQKNVFNHELDDFQIKAFKKKLID